MERRGVSERKRGIRAKQQRNLKLQMEFYDEEKDAADWSAYQFIFAPSPVVVAPPAAPLAAPAPPAAADGVPAPYPPAPAGNAADGVDAPVPPIAPIYTPLGPA